MASILDESAWSAWEKNGKSDFVDAVMSRLPSHSAESFLNMPQEKYKELKALVRDLFWQCVRGKLERDDVTGVTKELLEVHHDFSGLAVDVLCLLDIESSLGSKEEREKYLSLLKDLLKNFPEACYKERMELDTLGLVGVVERDKKPFTFVVRMKTKLYYKQQKYNLYREECEGYAKLITELNQDLSSTTPGEVLNTIKSIIGYFNIDPNRVLDVILDSFECRLDNHEFFLKLLRNYTPDPLTLKELVGFKIKYYSNKTFNEDKVVPDSLFRQIALMIQHEIMDMDCVYEMLSPSDEEMISEAEKLMTGAKEFVRKMNIVSTKDSEDKDDSNPEDKQTMDSPNTKLSLLKAMLEVGAWMEAETMISKFPSYYAVSHPDIAKALCQLIHITMEPVYEVHNGITSRLNSSKYEAHKNSRAPKPAATLEEFQSTVIPMLLTVGPYASADPILIFKVLRIIKTSLKIKNVDVGKDRDKAHKSVDPHTSLLYYDTITLMDELFLPALALSEANCCMAEEIWSVLRVFPYNIRYRLYGQWKGETYNLHPMLMQKKALVQKNIKRIMQRISKENVKPTSRAIGKLTHSSPGLLFDYILSQIQLYDNMIGPVVDSFRYLSNLSLDVLGFSIIEALNNPDKDRTKHDGTSISLWLQSLSNFCGSVMRKYNIELTGILQYVANQLKSKKSLDLLILKEIVLKMSGIETSEDMTSVQIDAMAGGEILRQEAGSFNQIKNTKKSSQRLKDALIDNNLAVPLCLLMAQQRTCVVYQETEDSHLKLVGQLFDQCQDTLVQFGQFLALNLSIDDYTYRLPPMSELLTRYHVNSDLAFFLARPMFNHQISLKYDEFRRQDKNWKDISDEEKKQKWVEAALLVMEPVTAAVEPMHPSKIWEDMTPKLLTTFWSLTMYDLFVPHSVYDCEIQRLKAMPTKIDENRELNSARKKKEKERVANLIEKLSEERRRQSDHVERVMARLRAERDNWFFSRAAKMAKNETITAFLQLCLFPRCVFTANDAIFCAKFVQIIHTLKTPNFSTLLCFDRIFCDITYTVTSCTENEAIRYGRFLSAMLEIVTRWHSKQEIFDKECSGYPGFVTKFRVSTTEPDRAQPQRAPEDTVDYENYRHVCHKWHYKIAKALVVCLESKDYVQIRNAVTVLSKIISYFPVIINLAGVIEKRVEKVINEEKENRKDLYIMASSYIAKLKSRRGSFVKEEAFHQTNRANSQSEGGTSLPQPAGPASGSNLFSKADKPLESKDRSQSREKSQSKGEREKSTPDRKSRSSSSKERGKEDRSSKDKDRASKERDRQSKDRQLKDSERQEMGPPQSTNLPRRSAEPNSEDRDNKRRKTDNDMDIISNHSSKIASPNNKIDADKSKDRKREREGSNDIAKKEKKIEKLESSASNGNSDVSSTKRRKDPSPSRQSGGRQNGQSKSSSRPKK